MTHDLGDVVWSPVQGRWTHCAVYTERFVRDWRWLWLRKRTKTELFGFFELGGNVIDLEGLSLRSGESVHFEWGTGP